MYIPAYSCITRSFCHEHPSLSCANSYYCTNYIYVNLFFSYSAPDSSHFSPLISEISSPIQRISSSLLDSRGNTSSSRRSRGFRNKFQAHAAKDIIYICIETRSCDDATPESAHSNQRAGLTDHSII